MEFNEPPLLQNRTIFNNNQCNMKHAKCYSVLVEYKVMDVNVRKSENKSEKKSRFANCIILFGRSKFVFQIIASQMKIIFLIIKK